MEQKIVKHTDLKWFWNLLETEEEVNLVVNYLKKGNKTITINKTYDARSGWRGENVILDGRDLSGNGYCFSADRLLKHVRGFEEYTKLKKTDEYKEYLKLKNKFHNIEQEFN